MEIDKQMLTDEIVASFLEGNSTPEETRTILLAAKKDARFREYLSLAAPQTGINPMMAYAATGQEDNLCTVRCEQYVLQCFGITISEEVLTQEASSADWLKDEGTPLNRIGALCSLHGLSVERTYHSSIEDVRKALSDGYQVIVALDGGEIDGDPDWEAAEDVILGKRPDHAVVVLSCDDDFVVCYNPYHGDISQAVPADRFVDAWDDSENYVVKIR